MSGAAVATTSKITVHGTCGRACATPALDQPMQTPPLRRHACLLTILAVLYRITWGRTKSCEIQVSFDTHPPSETYKLIIPVQKRKPLAEHLSELYCILELSYYAHLILQCGFRGDELMYL